MRKSNIQWSWRALLLSLLFLFAGLGCERIEDSIRNWGLKQRQTRLRKMETGQMEKWERDLNLSRARARELERQIQELVEERRLQGNLSWKIGRAFCDVGSYEAAGEYFRKAVRNESPGSKTGRKLGPFDRALPYFRTALQNRQLEAELIYDAGLCYANASRALGWEEDRFRTAEFLFQSLAIKEPARTRALYQLALLYGKSPQADQREPSRSIQLLKKVIGKDEYDLPARFALGNILTAEGSFQEALKEYRLIQSKLEELSARGNVRGSLKRNRQYIQAGKNIEQLEHCIENDPQCEISRQPGS